MLGGDEYKKLLAQTVKVLYNSRVRKTLRSHGHRPEEGPLNTIKAPTTHPSHAHLLLFCEKGLPSGMFLSGGKFATFLDSDK